MSVLHNSLMEVTEMQCNDLLKSKFDVDGITRDVEAVIFQTLPLPLPLPHLSLPLPLPLPPLPLPPTKNEKTTVDNFF